MILNINNKYRYTYERADSAVRESEVGIYLGAEVVFSHGSYDVFLTFRKEGPIRECSGIDIKRLLSITLEPDSE